ncbi:geranylgeranyl reductase family protein [Salidesulfovibrio brasiliensis]|uniref:geranylgeranyl reductase family protein n=1 Tax=Salidesulfovibrio brasiliensis TaxID=221711 RepID=UPI0006D1F4CB|nr:geranylgeranyl reductase family protein [Salidesulfovibrio brasiliensis]
MTYDHDIAVIGGGPAGSLAARTLARKGLSTLLIERAAMPRRKVCGGALSEHAMGYLDFPVPDSLIDWQCHGARVHYNNRTLTARLPERIAVLTTRSRFDHFLVTKAEEAGAETVHDEVKSIEQTESGVTIGLKSGRNVTARRCIIAAGANSRFIKAVRRRDTADEEGICIEAEVPVMTPDPFADLEGLIDIYFGGAAYGYGWVFHHGDYYSIGVGGVRSKFADPMRAMRGFCAEIGLTGWEESARAHPIPRGGIDRTISAGNLFLAGDSAGFVDPFYGEGLAYAIRSGQLAAEAAALSLDPAADAHTHYRESTEAEFAENLKYSLIFSKLMYSMPKLFLTTMTASESALRQYLYVPLNALSYREYLFWLLPRAPFIAAKALLSR